MINPGTNSLMLLKDRWMGFEAGGDLDLMSLNLLQKAFARVSNSNITYCKCWVSISQVIPLTYRCAFKTVYPSTCIYACTGHEPTSVAMRISKMAWQHNLRYLESIGAQAFIQVTIPQMRHSDLSQQIWNIKHKILLLKQKRWIFVLETVWNQRWWCH